jgi:outer membrane protein TolC
MSRWNAIRVTAVLWVWAAGAQAAPLSLGAYLDQVTRGNKAVQGLRLSGEGQDASAAASDLLFGPQLYSKAEYINDPRTSQVPAIEGDRKIHLSFELGVRQQTSFGLQYELKLEVNRSRLLGINPSLVTRPDLTSVYVIPQFQFALWQNWLGGMDRASRASDQAKARASALGDAYQAKGVLVDARGRYWKLAVLREVLRVQQESIDGAKALLQSARRKVRKHLGDASDVLLAEAAVKGKELELAGMEDEARAAARAFNTARGVDSEEVPETLPLPSAETLLAYQLPEEVKERGDVRAAEAGAVAASQGYAMAKEKLEPSLNLYGSIYAVGLNFTLPLEFGTVKEATRGYSQQAYASQLQLQQKRFEARTDWEALKASLKRAQEKLSLSIQLEDIQRRKLALTRKRLATGLTVPAQVIQFQLDYFQAVLARVHAQGDVLGVQTKRALFEEAE